MQADLRQALLTSAVKQEDLTRLNQEAATLANELGANKQVPYLEKETGRKLPRKVELLQETEARAALLETRLAESRARVGDANASCERAQRLCSELREERPGWRSRWPILTAQARRRNVLPSSIKQCLEILTPEHEHHRRLMMDASFSRLNIGIASVVWK
jgi:hypothetical protein